jgi:hypothetical protein
MGTKIKRQLIPRLFSILMEKFRFRTVGSQIDQNQADRDESVMRSLPARSW